MIFRVGPGQSLVLVLFLSLGVTAGPVGRFDEELEQAFQDIVESTGGASDEGGGLQRSHLSTLFHDISTLFKNVANILQTDRAPSEDETGEGDDDTEEISDERQVEKMGEDGEQEDKEIEQEEEPGEDGEQEDEEIEWEDTDDEDVELEEDVEQEEAEIERQEEDVELEEEGEQVEEKVQWEDNDAEDVELGEDGEQEEEEVEREDKDAEYVELAEDVEQEDEVVQWEDKDVEDVALGNVEEDGPDEEPDNAEQEAGQGGTVVNQDEGRGGQFFDEWTRRNFWLNRPRPHAIPQDVIEASRQREQEGQQREQQTLKEREREQQMLEEQQQEHQMLEERQHEQQMLEEPEHEQQILDELEPQHEQQILDEDNRLSSGGIDQSTANDKATVGEIAATNDIQPFEGSDGNQDHRHEEEPDNTEQETQQEEIAGNQDQGQGGQIFDEWTRRNFWLNRPHPHIIPQDVIEEREEQEQQMLEERVREQQMLEERQQEQRLLEERLREQQSAEERRQEQQMLEERKRERQMLEEQQREQQMLEEREREQQMLEERQQEQQMLEERQPGANDVSADNENPATNDIGQPGDTGGEGSSVDENHDHHPPNEVDQSTVNDEAAVEENNDLPPLGASGIHRPEPIASDEATGELASAPGDTSLPGGTKQWSPFDENVATMGKGGPSITIQRPPIHTGQNDDEASDEEGNSPFSGPWSPFTKNAPSFGKHPPHDHAHGPLSSGSTIGGAEPQQAHWAEMIHNMRKPNANPFRGKWSPFDENPPPFGRNPGSIG